jgi:hypothetical protein
MSTQHPYQCDICFQPYAPFSFMRVLPVTPIITLPPHVTRRCSSLGWSFTTLPPRVATRGGWEWWWGPCACRAPHSPQAAPHHHAQYNNKLPSSTAFPALHSPHPGPILPINHLSVPFPLRQHISPISSRAPQIFAQSAAEACSGNLSRSGVQKSVVHPVSSASFVSSATFSLCNGIRSPPLAAVTPPSQPALQTLCKHYLSNP